MHEHFYALGQLKSETQNGLKYAHKLWEAIVQMNCLGRKKYVLQEKNAHLQLKNHRKLHASNTNLNFRGA